ncbi:hypothetical protein ES288_A06G218400v1 [Gossypium darwinii]|uniref:Uncharacterized protein n=1 Tax=Gossypium darwinii TaxID=34276 RepID=A0A5D2G959_GOSDA|nr:hypothetical protein ES288_A06G218400v1 [Gossypium darwinii]
MKEKVQSITKKCHGLYQNAFKAVRTKWDIIPNPKCAAFHLSRKRSFSISPPFSSPLSLPHGRTWVHRKVTPRSLRERRPVSNEAGFPCSFSEQKSKTEPLRPTTMEEKRKGPGRFVGAPQTVDRRCVRGM